MTATSVRRRRARREGTCKTCRERFHPGDWITSLGNRRGWVHYDCATDSGETGEGRKGTGAKAEGTDELDEVELTDGEAEAKAAEVSETETKAQEAKDMEATETEAEQGTGETEATEEQEQEQKSDIESEIEREMEESKKRREQEQQPQDSQHEPDQQEQEQSQRDDKLAAALEALTEAVYKSANATTDLVTAELTRAELELEARKAEQEKEAPKHDPESVKPKCWDRLLGLAKARKNIYMVGPTGCGKTHVAKMVADELKLPFRFISCSAGMSEGQLLGRLLPTGKHGKFEYAVSDFVQTYENGGVFLFDEIDAADENTLIVLNAAIANGRLSVPSRKGNTVAYKHADTIIMAAANTYGQGSNREYVGRNALDAATLDRFRIGTVEMDYSDVVEKAICPDGELRQACLALRKRINDNKIRTNMSTRFMKDSYEMLQAGWTVRDCIQQFFVGLNTTQHEKLRPAATRYLDDEN